MSLAKPPAVVPNRPKVLVARGIAAEVSDGFGIETTWLDALEVQFSEGDTMDITQLILDDHHEQRRLFSILEQIDRGDIESLRTLWKRLAAFLETHALAEEELFYPDLLRIGKGAGGKDSAEDETEDAIKDHNEIRDAIAAVARHEVGSESWREAVAAANEANSDHMAEEEREGLTDFREQAGLALRHDLAVRFATFEAAHVLGVKAVDKDPKEYIAAHS